MKKKIYIYGTGRRAERYIETLNMERYDIMGFLDTYKQGMFYGKNIYKIDDILQKKWDEIHVATIYFEVFKLLLEKDIPKNKIVLCDKDLFDEYMKFSDGIQDMQIGFPTVLTQPMSYANGIGFSSHDIKQWSQDYCRYNTLYLLAKEIRNNKVDGCLAELGVFRGDFAKLMNAEFPERNLYLFDTFEGFDDRQKEHDLERGYITFATKENNHLKWFKDVSVNMMLDKMTAPDKCIVRKGLFPETIPDKEVRYSLVSIDCDIYIPALEGLKYFYPRLENGGYIMLHDYNGKDYQGIKQAVVDYENLIGRLYKVPIPDAYGTVVICK